MKLHEQITELRDRVMAMQSDDCRLELAELCQTVANLAFAVDSMRLVVESLDVRMRKLEAKGACGA